MPGHINNQTASHIKAVNPFDPASPLQWEEWVGDEGKREDTVTHGECLCTLKGFVLSPDLIQGALQYWLGWSEVDYSNPANPLLVRHPPAHHPEINTLFAKRVLLRGWKYFEKKQDFGPDGGIKVPYARYRKYFMEVDFQMPNYRVATTDSIASEWERFVSIETQDETLLAVIPGGTYTYRAVGQDFNGKPTTLAGPRMFRTVERTKYKITVWNLPYELITDSFCRPVKLGKAKGKVNKTDFLGMPPQTFLLESTEVEKHVQPVASDSWEWPQFGCNLIINGSYQEPTKAIATETFAGWNLVPGTKAGRWQDGWYGCQDDAGNPIYSACEMNNLITHWKKNDLAIGNP
jgi:hypothetical protein